ncbi:MAG: polyphosphate kinase 1 [Bacteroidetes bacterium]|nr:polyphosphate kinase 1 [Bacteroidota bacterium]
MAKIPVINREVSWLSFNERVLQEAVDIKNPVIERLRFLGIFSNNMDEFFRVRVGSLFRKINVNHDKKDKLLLVQIHKTVVRLQHSAEKTMSDLKKELEKNNVFLIDDHKLSKEHGEFVKDYFTQKVRPLLFPIMVKSAPKFPDLHDDTLYLAVLLKDSKNKEEDEYAIMEIPETLPRFVVLPERKGKKFVMFIDDVIRYNLKDIFTLFEEYDTFKAFSIKVTRDAELDIAADVSKSLSELLSISIKQRAKGAPVRFVYDLKIPDHFLNYILKKSKITETEILIPGGKYHNARDFMKFPSFGIPAHEYPSQKPLEHPDLKSGLSMFNVLKQNDVLLQYPYHSFTHVLDFLRDAAIDPKVRTIRMTIYRLAKESAVINALVNAAHNGKKVTVLMEIQARFDEAANIQYAKTLQEAGVNVVFGLKNLKVHSKLILISRRERNRTVRYACVGTGNFNKDTAKVFSDVALFTVDKRITVDIQNLFKFFEDVYKPYKYKNIVLSPFNTRKKINSMINHEIRNAKLGKRAEIFLKMNSLNDEGMVKKIYAAAGAGVKVRLLVRGICSVAQGLPELNENLEVRSLIGRYLEHSRIFIFHNAGHPKYFISSADFLTRNLDNRVEVTCPILDTKIKNEIREFVEMQWTDNVKMRVLDHKLSNTYFVDGKSKKIEAHIDYYNYLRKQK